MLSWRDIRNPLAGGAEKVTFELLKRFGDCTWFASDFGGLKSEEVDGVHIIRKGGRYSVYYHAYRYLRKRKFDLVIDQVNTVPFFTPLYYKGRKVAFFHQLCEEVWFYEMPFPLSYVGYYLEKAWLSLYRKVPALVVSESTRKGLLRHGIKKSFVMKDCHDCKVLPKVGKKDDAFVYVGRLKKSKRVDEIIKAFGIYGSGRLDVIGSGDDLLRLKRLAKGLNVVFHGYLPKTQRDRIVARSKAILVASVKEGWGLIVLEAASQGTPAIVYDVDGLRDSVMDGKTGLILKKNTPAEMAKAMKALKGAYASNALMYAKGFDWDESAREVKGWLEGVV